MWAEGFPDKPKGMHSRTYWRLAREYEDALNCSWPPWLGTSYRRLKRMDDARNAIATYQRLKEESAKKSQESLDKYKTEHATPPAVVHSGENHDR